MTCHSQAAEGLKSALQVLLCCFGPVHLPLCARFFSSKKWVNYCLSHRWKCGLRKEQNGKGLAHSRHCPPLFLPPRHTHTSIPPFSHEAMARGPAVFPYVGSCCWFLKDQRTVASKDCVSVHVTRMRVINKRPPTLQGLRKSLGLPFGASDGGQEDAQGDK